MEPADRWQKLNLLFEQALALEPTSRPAFLDSACEGDQDLRQDIESLLDATDDPHDVIASTVQRAARDVYSQASGAPLRPGARFSHYSVIQLLGSGGMGQVYLAEDLRLQRKIALKTLAPEYVNDPDALRRFEQEARAASALNHPNILTIYDIGVCDGAHFIACEFVEGSTVRDKLGGGALGPRLAADIAAQVATGLSAAHALGIIHRDIKPENIIVRADGLVKIVDFGVAKLTETSLASKKHPVAQRSLACSTSPGSVIGTARYMSPEQARGLPVDGRSDIFSLGSVLYEMATGQALFEGETASDLIAEILKTDSPDLCQVIPGAPAELGRIVARATRKNPAERYATAGEFASGLRGLESDVAVTDGAGLGLTRRRAGWLAAVFIAVVGAVAGFLHWTRTPTSAPSQPRSLAILPFRNLKEDPATDFLGFSLADAVITKFSSVGSLMVRPSSSIERYRKQTINPEKVGAELHVDALLTGTYIKEGGELRIAMQLISVKPATILWQRTIDTRYDSLLSVQDKIAQEIISGLELRLTPSEAANVRFDNAIGRQAYEDYLRGVDLYATNDFRSAIEMLQRSAARAPDYALTWAHLGRAYTTNASLAFGGREQYAQAQAAYEKALRLNPALIEPRVYMSNLFTDTGRVEQAVPLLQAALHANPNHAEAHWELGYAYRFAGFLPESVTECELARQLDPEVKLHSSALNSYLYLGQYDKFLASLPPDETAYALFYRGFAHFYAHRYAEAKANFEHAYRVDPSLLQAAVGEAISLAIQGRNAAGLRLMEQTEAKIGERGVGDAEGMYKVAQAYAVLGDKRSAKRVLRRTVDGGFFCYPYFQTDPLIAGLRSEPGFSELMKVSKARHDRLQAALKPDG